MTSRLAEKLAARVKGGDLGALADLFELWHNELLRVVEARLDQRLKGRIDPADVLQDAFLDLSKKLPDFNRRQAPMTPFAWMRMVVAERVVVAHRRHILANARDARREVSCIPQGSNATSVILVNHLIARATSISGRAVRNETSVAVVNAINSLDDTDREIITMRAFEELSNANAAEALGISENGASSRYVRAMMRLKRAIANIPELMD